MFLSKLRLENIVQSRRRRWNSEVDLYYFRNRAVSPVLGRFLQRDPLGYHENCNLYEFLSTNPVAGNDAFGLMTECECIQRAKEKRRTCFAACNFADDIGHWLCDRLADIEAKGCE